MDSLPLTTAMMPRTHSSNDLEHILAPSLSRRKKSEEKQAHAILTWLYRTFFVLVLLMRGIDSSSDQSIWSIDNEYGDVSWKCCAHHHHCWMMPKISGVRIERGLISPSSDNDDDDDDDDVSISRYSQSRRAKKRVRTAR